MADNRVTRFGEVAVDKILHLGSDVVIVMEETGIPAAGGNYAAFDGIAGPGSILISKNREKIYVNGGTLADNDWKLVTSA